MTSRQIIAVIGATGATAGGLARAILADPDRCFDLRAITRTPDSPAARRLAEAGADVVQADLDDRESLKHAFDGAYGAFCMTNFFVHFSAAHETEQAANLATAAGAAGVAHVIWSTAEDTRETPVGSRLPALDDGYVVPNWDGKGAGDRYFADVPTTYLLPPFHWDAFASGLGAPQPGPDGVRTLAMPLGSVRLPGMAAADIGRCAYGILQDPDRFIGARVGIAGEHLTGDELAAGLTRCFGEPVRYEHIPAEVFRSLPFPGADLTANMFEYVEGDPGYGERRDAELARELNPDLTGFDAWVASTTP